MSRAYYFAISMYADAAPVDEVELHEWLGSFTPGEAERIARWAMHAIVGDSIALGLITISAVEPLAEPRYDIPGETP